MKNKFHANKMNQMNKKANTEIAKFFGILFLGAIIILGVSMLIKISNPKDEDQTQIKKFNSLDEIKKFLKENQGGYESYNIGGVRSTTAGMESFAADANAGAPKASNDVGAGADDYSTTNIQVEGVDEPDFVKNDGKYIYVVSGNNVYIVEAYPAENMKRLSEINLTKKDSDEAKYYSSYISNIFINGDSLIVFANGNNYVNTGIECSKESYELGIRCGGYYEQSTIVNVYDISDKENPELKHEYSFDGDYVDARMIGDYVYLISNKYVYLNSGNEDIILPMYSIDGVEKTVLANEIYYFPYYDYRYIFTSINAISLDNGKSNSKVYMTGASNTLFVSKDNIYLTYSKRMKQSDYYEKMIDEVFIPLLPSKEANKIKDIMDSDDEYYERIKQVGDVIEDYSNSLTGEERSDFDKEMMEKLEEYQIKVQKEIEKTIVHRVNIDKLNIDYKSAGEVPGNVLNQFSMDENDGYFRIATTTGDSWRDTSLNNLYVLDIDNMEIVGQIEDLAQGERIYSTRFIGDRAYIVTFKQVDPLFVIDLKDPQNPEVLGYLKVTGYSSYLHPYDENHIIGVGMDADENGRTMGIKISLFDVSDVENPKEAGKYAVSEGKWSYSDALYDHKAFLFDKERNLLVIPVSYTKETGANEKGWPNYEYWQGAYVLDISLDGIDLKGKINHETKKSDDEYGYYGYGNYVRRSLYMDNILYTISNGMIKANNLQDLNEISNVELPYEEPRVYYGESGGIAVDSVAVTEK